MGKRDPNSIRCPKCGNSPQLMHEMWDGACIEFEVLPNGNIAQEGELNPGGPASVYAECACDHKWKLPGIRQITDLRPD